MKNTRITESDKKLRLIHFDLNLSILLLLLVNIRVFLFSHKRIVTYSNPTITVDLLLFVQVFYLKKIKI